MSKLRVKDEVVVIAGNNRGQQGKILAINGERVVVEGVNIRKKHRKPRQQNEKGQIIDVECPIHLSNVRPCVEGKAVKLRVRYNQSNEKELFFNDGKKETLFRSVKKMKK